MLYTYIYTYENSVEQDKDRKLCPQRAKRSNQWTLRTKREDSKHPPAQLTSLVIYFSYQAVEGPSFYFAAFVSCIFKCGFYWSPVFNRYQCHRFKAKTELNNQEKACCDAVDQTFFFNATCCRESSRSPRLFRITIRS